MAGALNLLTGALNSNVGQTLVTAGAQRAAAEIYDASGFGGEEVDSPTAKVEAAPAPMAAAAQPKVTRKPSKPLVISSVVGVVVLLGYLSSRRKKKGGK